MPYSVNGIGTSVCRARGEVSWSLGQPVIGPGRDCDAVICFVLLTIPLVPLQAVHTFDWQGDSYRWVPIRLGVGLLLRAVLRRILGFVAVLSILVGLGAYFSKQAKADETTRVLLIMGSVVTSCALVQVLLSTTDRRNRNLRYVLGRHSAGSSDPFTWHRDMLAKMRSARELYGTDSFADAVPAALESRYYARAMWAARLCAALEDRSVGERLTDDILRSPDVQAALARVKKNPADWNAVMMNNSAAANAA